MYRIIVRDINKKDMPIRSSTEYMSKGEAARNLPRTGRIDKIGTTYVILVAQ